MVWYDVCKSAPSHPALCCWSYPRRGEVRPPWHQRPVGTTWATVPPSVRTGLGLREYPQCPVHFNRGAGSVTTLLSLYEATTVLGLMPAAQPSGPQRTFSDLRPRHCPPLCDGDGYVRPRQETCDPKAAPDAASCDSRGSHSPLLPSPYGPAPPRVAQARKLQVVRSRVPSPLGGMIGRDFLASLQGTVLSRAARSTVCVQRPPRAIGTPPCCPGLLPW